MHHGRYTLISHALAGERSLAEVTDVVAHANVSNTNCYLHVAMDDETGLGKLHSIARKTAGNRFH